MSQVAIRKVSFPWIRASLTRDLGRIPSTQWCEKKLAKAIVPDKWNEGAYNTSEGGGRKINENKLLSKKNNCP